MQIVQVLSEILKAARTYKARFIPDLGFMRSDNITKAFWAMAIQNEIYNNIQFAWFGESGYKHRVASATASFWSKLYSTYYNPIPIYGSELAINGSFATDANWIKGAGVTISGGVLQFTSAGNAVNANQIILQAGKTYKVTYTILNYVSGSVRFLLGGSAPGLGTVRSANGTYTESVTNTSIASQTYFYFSTTTTNNTFSIDNVSVVEVLQDGLVKDATQTTELNQPYLSGNIAPNEKFCLNNPNGSAKFITHPTISFAANEAWSVSSVLNSNFGSGSNYFIGDGTTSFFGIDIAGLIKFRNASNTLIASTNTYYRTTGKNSVIQLVADGLGGLKVYLNNTLVETFAIPTNFVISRILKGLTAAQTSGKLYAHIIRSGALTPSQITSEYNFFRSIYPEIETVKIGNQEWATSNLDVVATCQGNVISNITENVNVEKVVNGGFDSDTGWTLGVGHTIENGLLNINSATSTFSYQSSGALPNKRYKVTYTITNYVYGGVRVTPNSVTAGILRSANGTYIDYIFSLTGGQEVFISAYGASQLSVDNVSVQEIGWAGSTELYDGIYAATSGTVEQKTYAAVKAAAMWCYYNNDAALGAIYGKLYNWYAAKLLQMDIDYYNAANPTTPWGYRVPTSADFTTLQTTLGGSAVAGGKMKVAGTNYWTTPNTGADNSSGFSAIGGGYRDYLLGVFANIKLSNQIWCINNAYVPLSSSAELYTNIVYIQRPTYGMAIRLIKN